MSTVSPRVEFVYKVEGRIDELDVFDLAPALLALGHVIQEANRTANPSGPDLAVSVRPFGQGSFLCEIAVGASASLPVLAAVLGPNPVEKISEVLKLIGFIRGAATSAIEAIKQLRGSPKTATPVAQNMVQLTNGNNTVTVSGTVHNLLINPVFNQYIDKAYKPLDDDRVEDIASFLKGQEPTTGVVIDKRDAAVIREFSSSPKKLGPTGEQVIENTLPEVFLKPRRGPFSGDPTRWSFTMGDRPITATIRDRRFLADYDRDLFRIHRHDLLKVKLLVRQKVQGTNVTPTYEILEVLDLIRGGEDGQTAIEAV